MSIPVDTDETLAGSASPRGSGSPEFIQLRLDVVDALGGSWEAAGVWERVRYRAGADGWWTVTIAELCAEVRLSDRKLRRALQELRDAGWLEAERSSAFNPTQRFRAVRPGIVAAPAVNDKTSVTCTPETSFTVNDKTSFSLSSKNRKNKTPHETSRGPSNEAPVVLALVASGDVEEPALFASDEVAKPETGGDAWPQEASPNGCRQAWIGAWIEARGVPDPSIKRRAFGVIRGLVKDRETLEDWQALWRACHAAGRTGRWNVAELLAPAPVRYGQNAHVALAEQAAHLGLLDELLSGPARPAAIGGPR